MVALGFQFSQSRSLIRVADERIEGQALIPALSAADFIGSRRPKSRASFYTSKIGAHKVLILLTVALRILRGFFHTILDQLGIVRPDCFEHEVQDFARRSLVGIA